MFSLSNWNYGIIKKVNFIYEVNEVETLHFFTKKMNSLEEKDVVVMMTIKSGKKYFFIKKNVVFWRKSFPYFVKEKLKKKRNIFPQDFWTVIRSFSMFQVSFFRIISFDCIIDTCLTLPFCFCQFGNFCFSLPK